MADVRQVAAQAFARRALLTAAMANTMASTGGLAQGLIDLPVGHVGLRQLAGERRPYHHSLPDHFTVATLELELVEPHVQLVVVHVPGHGHQAQPPAYHFLLQAEFLAPRCRSVLTSSTVFAPVASLGWTSRATPSSNSRASVHSHVGLAEEGDQLVAQAHAGEVADKVHVDTALGEGPGLLVHAEAVAVLVAHRPEDARGVLDEAEVVEYPDRTLPKVAQASEEVDHGAEVRSPQGDGHGVDGEIAPEQVLSDRGVLHPGQRGRIVVELGARGGDVHMEGLARRAQPVRRLAQDGRRKQHHGGLELAVRAHASAQSERPAGWRTRCRRPPRRCPRRRWAAPAAGRVRSRPPGRPRRSRRKEPSRPGRAARRRGAPPAPPGRRPWGSSARRRSSSQRP